MLNRVQFLKSELDAFRPLGREQEAIIMQKFRLDWNYHSNHLEGNSLTYGETKALILFGLTAQGKPLKDHFEITGHDQAIKWIEDIIKQEYPLTQSFIRELHVLLLQKPYQVDAITPEGLPTKRWIEVGTYKTAPNHVLTKTGEIFRFATPEETPAKMHDLMDWLREKQANLETEPVLLAAEFHYKFIRIHPFDDGNGRTARLLMNFILMQYGFPPVIIKTEDKESYFNVLRLADAGSIEPFVNYIAENLAHSLEIMIKGAKGESIDEPDDLDKEIALLEQKLKGVGKKIEKTKSKETILEFYDDSFTRLYRSFCTACKKLNTFYAEIDFEIYNNFKWLVNLGFVRQLIKSNADNLGLRCKFSKFKMIDNEAIVYESTINISFGFKSFTIISENNGIILEKYYWNPLTDEEITFIVNTEMKRHTAFIESKIKEIQAQ